MCKTDALIKNIIESIETGRYQPNQLIPSIRVMAKKSGISTYTVSQAYERLVASGHLTSIQGVGFLVQSVSPSYGLTIEVVSILTVSYDIFTNTAS